MKLYNTMSRTTAEIKPLNGNKISLYTCGLTVYSQPHIGNWVSYIYWDVLVRTLKISGFDVTRVQNITDVGHLTSDEDAGEDKMLKSALQEGTTAWDVAKKYIKIADDEAYNQLGLLRPDHMPRATEYIPQQIAFVKGLEEKGFTYVTTDGVYFDTSKLDDYGKLARLDIEGLQFGARVADTGKKNPTDFALWKLSPDPPAGGEKRDMEWDSPWGRGFPGWHLECSVMARELLGDTIDIHTGGIDHIPVHHTNEIAQSEALTGKPFASNWVHANHIKVDGTKMSKSLGNVYTIEDIKNKGFSLDAFKLMILSKHYSTEGNFTWEILEAAQNTLNSFSAWADLKHQNLSSEKLMTSYKEALTVFSECMFNNLDTPGALATVNGMINKGDKIGWDSSAIDLVTRAVDDYFNIGLSNRDDISDEQKQLIKAREDARYDKNWAESDSLRDELKAQGIEVRDTENGTIWSRLG